MSLSRREFLTWLGATGAAIAGISRPEPIVFPTLEDLLPYYAESTRRNIVRRRGQRAILSSRIYPKGTFVRDACYGPLALNDVALSSDCYRWFERTQLPGGQIMTAVGFTEEDQGWLTPMDDDSSLLFVIWSAWLARRGVEVKRDVVEQAFAYIQSHVNADGEFVSPAGPFRYWADTVSPEAPERITHNQGLYALALKAMRSLGWSGVTDDQVTAAKQRYARCYDPSLKSLTLGRDTWWALKQDISSVFPEFLFRWAFADSALPDAVIMDTVARCVQTASVYENGKIAGIKVICDTGGAFLPADRFNASVLNSPGDYQNGGYWPMYTLIALALAYKIAPSQEYKSIVETLVIAELSDHVSKEVIRLKPGEVGTWDPKRNGYTWNALIAPALRWAGIV
ncbi:MAG TPA: hypothetical protein VIK33_13325 [Anaerolineae bacterium]